MARIEWIETAGELGALLAESRLIRELLPLLNRRERRVANLRGRIDSPIPLDAFELAAVCSRLV
jgi:hypothetical protein